MRSALFLILTTWIALLRAPIASCAEPVKADRTADEYAKIAARYGIEIVLEEPKFPADGTMTGRTASPKNLQLYFPMFAAEWNFYPTELIERSGLRRVVLCEEYRVQGIQRGGAVPNISNNPELFLDVGPLPWSRLYTRAIIHHELFHVIDQQIHREAGIRDNLADASWEALNSDGFKYDSKMQADLQSPRLDPKLKGFLSRYAMGAVYEDKAVLYSFMITQGQIINDRAKTDPVLQAKMLRLKAN
jgi:hypothetical protein